MLSGIFQGPSFLLRWTIAVALFALLITPGFTAAAGPKSASSKKTTRSSPVTKKTSTVKKPVKTVKTPTKKSKSPVISYKGKKSTKAVRKSTPVPPRPTVPPVPRPVALSFTPDGYPLLQHMPGFAHTLQGRVAGLGTGNEVIYYTLDPNLQRLAEKIVSQSKTPHVALVAIEPETGAILAMAERSILKKPLLLHSSFPAASLFKVVTAAAGIEKAALRPSTLIKFRGNTYSLERWNYLPDPRKDYRTMPLSEALGRSCNPVFGRVALNHLNSGLLRAYSASFGFNDTLPSDIHVPASYAFIPDDDYNLSRTAAGFGEIRISPMHAAALMAAVANGGLMPRPAFIRQILSPQGQVLYEHKPEILRHIVKPETAAALLHMMETTTTIGTSRREFMPAGRPVLPGIHVAGKTGTLSGNNPKGLNNWFIGAAPISNPKIAVAVITVDARGAGSKASHLARLILQKYLKG